MDKKHGNEIEKEIYEHPFLYQIYRILESS